MYRKKKKWSDCCLDIPHCSWLAWLICLYSSDGISYWVFIKYELISMPLNEAACVKQMHRICFSYMIKYNFHSLTIEWVISFVSGCCINMLCWFVSDADSMAHKTSFKEMITFFSKCVFLGTFEWIYLWFGV